MLHLTKPQHHRREIAELLLVWITDFAHDLADPEGKRMHATHCLAHASTVLWHPCCLGKTSPHCVMRPLQLALRPTVHCTNRPDFAVAEVACDIAEFAGEQVLAGEQVSSKRACSPSPSLPYHG